MSRELFIKVSRIKNQGKTISNHLKYYHLIPLKRANEIGRFFNRGSSYRNRDRLESITGTINNGIKRLFEDFWIRDEILRLLLLRSTIDTCVILEIGRWMPDILNVNRTILVLPSYMLLYVRCLLRDEIAVRALEARRLSAFIFLVRHQAGLLAVYAPTIRAAKLYASIRHVPRIVVRVSYQSERRTETCKRKSSIRKFHKIRG